MRWRPAYLWLLGLLPFGGSVFIWGLCVVLGHCRFPLDADGVRYGYLPMLAAVIGFSLPLAALRLCWNARLKTTVILLTAYWLLMLAWGVFDIRHLNYQIGGHYSLGHTDYFHSYFTWHFLPYRLIEP